MDDPDKVHALLTLVTQTYITMMEKWHKLWPPQKTSYHWGFMHTGSIVVRNDSAMNFSPVMFREFIAPYDTLLMEKYQGGVVHFCGRGDHYIDQLAQYPGLCAVHLTQPSYNDMEIIFQNTVIAALRCCNCARTPCRMRRDAAVKRMCGNDITCRKYRRASLFRWL